MLFVEWVTAVGLSAGDVNSQPVSNVIITNFSLRKVTGNGPSEIDLQT